MTQLFHFWVFEISPESIQPCAMKNRDIYWKQFKIQETLYIGQWNLSPLQSRPWELTQFSQLPSAALLYFPESHRQSEISSVLKPILVLGKAGSHRAPNLGCRGEESLGWFDVSPKNSAWEKLCIRHDAWVGAFIVMKMPITSCP